MIRTTTIFKKKYATAAEVADVLKQVETIGQLTSVYHLHSEMIEADAALKEKVINLKIKLYPLQ